MLSENERKHASLLLSALSDTDLQQLARTITNRANFESKSREDAIELILKYEEDVPSLLSRKKITRQLICHYLHWVNAEFSPNHDKATLQATVIKLWSSTPYAQVVNRVTDQNSSIGICETSPTSEGTNSSILIHQQPIKSDDRIATIDNRVSSSNLNENVQEMASKFCEWFYNLVNEDFWKRGNEVFSPEHLFQECRVVVKLENGSDSSVSEATTNIDGASLLRSVCVEHSLLLNPNLTDGEGVRGVSERHGAVIVLACGTLHVRGDCVGVFEQAFTLVRDPMANDNWKIKFTEIRLKSKAQSRVPTLAEGEMTKRLMPA